MVMLVGISLLVVVRCYLSIVAGFRGRKERDPINGPIASSQYPIEEVPIQDGIKQHLNNLPRRVHEMG